MALGISLSVAIRGSSTVSGRSPDHEQCQWGVRSPGRSRSTQPAQCLSIQYQPAQYQLWDRLCAQAPQGVPYRPAMYFSPQVIWVAGLVRQSAPAEAIFRPGRDCGMP